MNKCGIYLITNLVNQKKYVGQSVNILRRWRNHKADSKNIASSCYEYPLYRAFRKYGIDNFSFEIIEECSPMELDIKEAYYIGLYRTLGENGYNQVKVQQAGTKIKPKNLKAIIDYLEETDLSTEEIGKIFNISGRAVRAINTGESWYDENIKYPIRKKFTQTEHLCIDCGKPTSGKEYIRCSKCTSKARIISLDEMQVTREELKNKIRTMPFTKIGLEYKVSDNAIRKWCEKFNLPTKKKEIKKYTDEEWASI